MNEYVKQIASGVVYQLGGAILSEIQRSSKLDEKMLIDMITKFISDNNLSSDYPCIREWESTVVSKYVMNDINDYGLEMLSINKLPLDYSLKTGERYLVHQLSYLSISDIKFDTIESDYSLYFGIGETVQGAIDNYVWKKMEMLAIPTDLWYIIDRNENEV